MPTQRRKDLVRQRRRVRDDGDDEGSILTEAIDDSQSEGSIPTDAEDDADADADYSDLSEPDMRESARSSSRALNSGSKTQPGRSASVPGNSRGAAADIRTFDSTEETKVMMNGLSISDDPKEEALDFDASENTATDSQKVSTNKRETISDKRRREHEEYKQKRDSDPAFIPTRGAFFMHDSRHSYAANGSRGYGRGRGRGRGGPALPFHSSGPVNEPTNNPWSHDLHESLLEVDKPTPPAGAPSGPSNAFAGTVPSGSAAIVRSFSTTQTLGKVLLRVLLPGMKEPIPYSDVTVKRYTKLPNHRPPLRRDKPVRVSIPDHTVRFIFPSMERSFIFIPRALRPNQQGFGRGRGKGLNTLGGFSSRRTSIYNGSMYSPSIAMSRRSSIARDGMASPAASIISGRPVVRLPPGVHHQHTGSGTPIHSGGISSTSTPAFGMPPQGHLGPKPTYRENWPANIQMHQPRPQKAISVTGIENPASSMHFSGSVPLEQQQPFHHQVPNHVNGGIPQDPYAHTRQQSYPNVPQSGTPLSNIPERAIHAQPFQPYQQAGYPQPYAGQPAYYYPAGNPASNHYQAGAVVAPMYVQSPQAGGYIMPTIASAGPPPVQPVASAPTPGSAPGLVAHEQNGMVYYYDPAQAYQPISQQQQEGYAPQQNNYQMPMMNSAPEGYYYPQMPQGTIYYQQQ